jgi:DivIVA domain-containing protein
VAVIVAILVGVVVLLGAAVLLSMREGGMSQVSPDHRDLGIPDRLLTADDMPALRFRVGFRGYRMDDVDAALAKVTEALRAGSAAATSPVAEAPAAELPVEPLPVEVLPVEPPTTEPPTAEPPTTALPPSE